MKYSVVFQQREQGRVPEEQPLGNPIEVSDVHAALIPCVGDHVAYSYKGQPTQFKVLDRQFTYFDDSCRVEIEVGGSREHGPLNLKE